MVNDEVIRIFVGADRSQLLAVPVLEHSIKRHTDVRVEVIPMRDLPIRIPRDPRNGQRTGFSFSRFCIPKLTNYQGKAIYMDADMLVLRDIRELWNIPFDGAKVIIQDEVKHEDITLNKVGAPVKRKKQCAVMLLDCSRLQWDIDQIVSEMDEGNYDYEGLMYDLCILKENEIKYGVPFEWNSLEHYDAQTRLIHYTDVYTQPWTSVGNRWAELWFDEVRLMLRNGALTWGQLKNEVELGYFRPSILFDIRYRHRLPAWVRTFFDKRNMIKDKLSGYIPHKDVYAQKRIRQNAIKAYDAQLASNSTVQSSGQ
jgi:lipopolysaccharide biosynthesis glycosyltransferase